MRKCRPIGEISKEHGRQLGNGHFANCNVDVKWTRGMERNPEALPGWSTLPVDVIVKIAFAISSPADLVAFLDALRPYNLLGPLEDLYNLTRTCQLDDLWPSLRLTSELLVSPNRSSYEEIAKFYTNVVVQKLSDVEWLKAHLNTKAKIQWTFTTSPLTMEIVESWFDLNITSIVIMNQFALPSGWK
ncbi:hypothetical protein AeNC1_011624 [Aphanomyces euteiches]|nr:hypothetical protein AeNC1_011624 [Aphanomyces euteiches]